MRSYGRAAARPYDIAIFGAEEGKIAAPFQLDYPNKFRARNVQQVERYLGGTMEQHVKILGILNIVWGALEALCGLVILMVFGGAYGIVANLAYNKPQVSIALPFIAIVGGVISLLLLVSSAPSIVAGIGLTFFKPWARILAIVVSILHLLNIPFGTALGIYGLWVLFSPRSESLFTTSPLTQEGP
jgi:hypothetical protein